MLAEERVSRAGFSRSSEDFPRCKRQLSTRVQGVNKVTRMMRVEAPRQFLPNVRSSGLALRLALAKGMKKVDEERNLTSDP